MLCRAGSGPPCRAAERDLPASSSGACHAASLSHGLLRRKWRAQQAIAGRLAQTLMCKAHNSAAVSTTTARQQQAAPAQALPHAAQQPVSEEFVRNWEEELYELQMLIALLPPVVRKCVEEHPEMTELLEVRGVGVVMGGGPVVWAGLGGNHMLAAAGHGLAWPRARAQGMWDRVSQQQRPAVTTTAAACVCDSSGMGGTCSMTKGVHEVFACQRSTHRATAASHSSARKALHAGHRHTAERHTGRSSQMLPPLQHEHQHQQPQLQQGGCHGGMQHAAVLPNVAACSSM